LLVTYNPGGQVEGVKYDRLSVVFVNAFKEQQAQINQQQQQIKNQQEQLERQQKQIDGLKQFVCSRNPRAGICR
jgi:type III secretory pathway lipoprotein EscJ